MTNLEPEETDSAPDRKRVTARQVVEWSARTTAGIVTAAIAGGMAFTSLFFVPPTWSVAAPSVVVTPQPAGTTLVCAGSVLRLADDSGAGASQASAIGEPTLALSIADTMDDGAELRRIATTDAGTGDTAQAPSVVTAPAGDLSQVAGGLEVQQLTTGSIGGLVASPCTTPSLRSWVVGGATTLGRTSILTLTNPSDVESTVDLRLYGESGEIDAPGMSGIVVPPNSQRIIPVNGLAVDLVAPVIQVSARGGAIAAALQQSIVRGLETGGVDLVPAQEPTTDLVVTGIKVASQSALQAMTKATVDEDDVIPILRLLAPGTSSTEALVSIVPLGLTIADAAAAGDHHAGDDLEHDHGEVVEGEPQPRQFTARLTGGIVSELRLTGLPAGEYSVFVSSPEPIVGAVRTATIDARVTAATPVVDPAQPQQQAPTRGNDPSSSGPVDAPAGGTVSPLSVPVIAASEHVVDFAWYSPAAALGEVAGSAVPEGFATMLAIANPGVGERTVELDGANAEAIVVPAGGWVILPLDESGAIILRGAEGLSAAITVRGTGLIAQATLQPPAQLARPVTVFP